MTLTDSHRVPDPCCHSCPSLIAKYNLRHSIKTGNKAKKGSVYMFGQPETLEKGSKKVFREGGRGDEERAEVRVGGKGERKEENGKQRGKVERGRGKAERGRKRKPFHICVLCDLKCIKASCCTAIHTHFVSLLKAQFCLPGCLSGAM